MAFRIRPFFLAMIWILCFALPTPVEAGLISSSVERVLIRKAAQKAAARQVAERAATEKVAAKRAAAKKVIQQAEAGKSSGEAKNKAIRAWDQARDKIIPVKPLEKPKTVYRYTNRKQAINEQTIGIGPNTHMTSKEIGPGRPLSRATAKERYGLANEPQSRITVAIPNGQPVRKARVIAGRPGYGEITSPKWIPPENIIEVRPMP